VGAGRGRGSRGRVSRAGAGPVSDIIERAALVIANRMTDEDFAARGTDGAVFSEHDTRHLAEALADAGIIATEVEQAVRKAINELENLISKYTIAHPENTMRVLGLLWADQRRIADYLRRSLDAHDEEAEAERDRLAETVDRVRALHYPNTTFGI